MSNFEKEFERCVVELRRIKKELAALCERFEALELRSYAANCDPEELRQETRAFLLRPLRAAERDRIKKSTGITCPDGCDRLTALQAIVEHDNAGQGQALHLSDEETNNLICGLLDIIDALRIELDRVDNPRRGGRQR